MWVSFTRGGILLSKDLDDMKLNIHKIQCVLREGEWMRTT